MNIAEYSIRNKVISWMFALILLLGGISSFFKLGQLEFPEFTIKDALVVTSYPGATPQQVEEEVSVQLEDAIQQLAYIDHVTSINSTGLSQIKVEIKDTYNKDTLPQVWDELRRKVYDAQASLPPGVRPSLVVDDFGDVFGILLNITGAGYSYHDLEDYADLLRRELVLVPGVKKVSIDGSLPERVYVEISREKMTALGISMQRIFDLLKNQNVVSNAGDIFVGDESIRIHPTGEFNDVKEMERLLISASGSEQLVYLGDIATIQRAFTDQPNKLYHLNSEPALSLGVSFMAGVNVVDVGRAVMARIDELEGDRPLGMEITNVYNQAEVVDQSVSAFLINLLEAVAIVIVVLLVFMGARSGILMGLILLLTILGTFIVMQVMAIDLQIISLGALVIALGMLVDNAIVITEGMLIGLQKGLTKLEAAKAVVDQTKWPLLGATVIAIMAFAPIGLSADSTGEFVGSLFWVLLVALFLSWITAITLTPFFFDLFYKELNATETTGELYQGAFFEVYKVLLSWCLKHRIITIVVVVAMLASAIFGFTKVKNVFFPASTTPIFFVDYWLPEGTDIRATNKAIAKLEKEVKVVPGVMNVTAVIGGGSQRFVLPYAPEDSYSSYGQLIVNMEDLELLEKALVQVTELLRTDHPKADFRVKKLENGPAPAAKIEARFYGESPEILRQLAAQAIDVFNADPWTDNIRHSWRNRVKVIRPELLEEQARRAGITKNTLDEALLVNFSGKVMGTYRDGTDLIPIVVRAPDKERLSASSLTELQVWSPEYSTYLPISQITSGIHIDWENPLIKRRDRKRMLAVYADPVLLSDETADSVFKRIKKEIESIPLPDGYELEWGGEYETATKAQASLFGSLPVGLLFMFLITVLLFNTTRQPIVIWLTVPLSLIGVVGGLLLLNKPFSFMALLGLLSLIGMLLKNGIVLVEQIKLEADSGKNCYDAIFHASVSRVRPVCMAAITTMLGMIPLVVDAFFESMAVTIIFGLGCATLLTLIVLPVLYAVFYRVKI
ncbi:efflux RND transporter permease subunit [Spartinivicinus ruber]|uniref:efflux RND transporter permease subunit n=1 Tax=Spartinivicinus ruber TaxID=2683272 RepID=UPI0013D158AD|nr:efflux RND transporter permease subunit [Spartinivicinus ruber]